MPLVKGNVNIKPDDARYVVIGVGGAGAHCVSELARILPQGGGAICVDRTMDDMAGIQQGRRVALGYPLYNTRAAQFADIYGDAVDESDLYRLKVAIGDATKVFVLAGLGGNTTRELLPPVMKIARERGASLMTIVTLPFAFEGERRRNAATSTLECIRDSAGALAVIDAAKALSRSATAGNMADDLAVAQARVLMAVLTASGTALNSSIEISALLQTASDTFVSYSTTENISQYRKLAGETLKRPLTSSVKLHEADRVVVIVSGPSDLPIKILDGIMSVVERAIGSDTSISMSFQSLDSSPNSTDMLRITILACRGAVADIDEPSMDSTALKEPTSIQAEIASISSDFTDRGFDGDLSAAPEWLTGTRDAEHQRALMPARL